MKINNIFSAKFFVVYIYGVFILNVVSIFYMDRANNNLDNQIEFLSTLILPIFIGLVSVAKNSKSTPKLITLALIGLFVGGPIVFFAHVVLTL